MTTEELTQAWAKLNVIQREAAEWNAGPLLVLAGPGSGKTNVLTCRIARLLAESPGEPFRILALTFTNKAAGEMRQRVEKLAPGQYYRLFVGTFHSFCADILRQHGVHVNINPNFDIYSTDADLEAVLNKVVEDAAKKHPIITDQDKKTLPIIKRLKSLLVSPDSCQKFFSDQAMGARMAIVYPAYEMGLRKRNAVDFESLIFETYRLFTLFPSIARRLRTVYEYICVDEFQDTNKAQYDLIRALTADAYKNLYVVADDDQIIYQWNGASHKRIEEFVTDYHPAIRQLPLNYRCPPEVVTIANNLIAHNFLRRENKKPIEAYKGSSSEQAVMLLRPFSSEEAEGQGVALDIQAKRMSRIDQESVAVIARTRRTLLSVQQALHALGIASVFSQRKSEFESTPFMWLNAILRLANDRQSVSNLEIVCGTFAQLTSIDIDPEEVITQAKSSNNDFLKHWLKILRQRLSAQPLAGNANGGVVDMIGKTSRYLGEGFDYKNLCEQALVWFDNLVHQVNESVAGADPTTERFARYQEEKEVWNELYRDILSSADDGPTLEAFLQELRMRSKEPALRSGTVVLMTIHSAKGKEFDHVYLVGLVEDELPSFQSKKKGDRSPDLEEERRNCFVAITRTQRTLTLSYARRYRGWLKEPSRFLREMGLLAIASEPGLRD